VDPLPAAPLVDQAVRRVHLARPEVDDVALVDPRLVPRPVVADDPAVELRDEAGHPVVEARTERLDELRPGEERCLADVLGRRADHLDRHFRPDLRQLAAQVTVVDARDVEPVADRLGETGEQAEEPAAADGYADSHAVDIGV